VKPANRARRGRHQTHDHTSCVLIMRRWLGRESGELRSPAVSACWLDVKRVYMHPRVAAARRGVAGRGRGRLPDDRRALRVRPAARVRPRRAALWWIVFDGACASAIAEFIDLLID
jgi:hypothetical protein